MDTLQNKFIDNVYQLTAETGSVFVLANAGLDFYPIIYCSQGFFEDVGHTRNEVTTKDVYLRFMCGRQTDEKVLKTYDRGVKKKETTQVELMLYSRGGTKRWYLVTLIPITDDNNKVAIFLVLFNYISHMKGRIPDSPMRLWRRGVRRALNKPSLEYFRKNIDAKKDAERKNKSDVSTIKAKIKNAFIPMYGLTKPQVPSYLIHHASPKKFVWDSLILVCILYTSVMVPFIVSFKFGHINVVIVDTIVDVAFLFDIILTFFTTYASNAGELVSSAKLIRKNYLKGWFTLDFVAALPYSVVNFSFNNSNLLEILSFMKIVRLIRLGKVGKKISRYTQMSAVTLGVWLLVFSLCAHWMACIWYIIATRIDDMYVAKESWLIILADVTNQPYNFTASGEIVEGTGPTLASKYISALYYTMSSLTTCGFGNIAPNSSAEKFFGCVTMLLGCVLYALIFGQVTNIISQLQKGSNEFTDRLTSIKNFNRIYKMPPHVAKRLEDYFTATWSVTKGTDEEEIMKPCPRDLQSDLCLNIHKVVFDSNIAFKHLSDSALRALSRYFWTIRTAPGDKLITTGETVDTIYFVATGSLEVYSSQDLTGLIGPDDAWGKRLTDVAAASSVYDVKSCSFGAIHCISCSDVRDALKLFPEEYDKIKYDLDLSFDITRQLVTVTKSGEIISTEELMSDKLKEVALERSHSTHNGNKNVYVLGDDVTTLEHSHSTHSDVLSGMSELKGELRRETERMNAKMGIVEAQMRLVLKMLRRSNKIELDPEIGIQLDELMEYENDPDAEDNPGDFEWFVADSHGWKETPPATSNERTPSGKIKKRVIMSKPRSLSSSSKSSCSSSSPPKDQATAQLANKPKSDHTVVNINSKRPSQYDRKPQSSQNSASSGEQKSGQPTITDPKLANQGFEGDDLIETIHL